jgi:phosphonate transport system substrate-binding protein
MKNLRPVSIGENSGVSRSRRRALRIMLGACGYLPRAMAYAGSNAPLRLAISESLVSGANIADARAAMMTWLKRMEIDLNLVIEFSPKVFDTTEEILRRARANQFDAVALNVVEYRQIADVLDPNQIIADSSTLGLDQYVLLVKRSSGATRLSDLRGRRLTMLSGNRMCIATAWLSTLLDEGHLGRSEQFFSSVTTDTKASRVVLPVFFGQYDACLTSKRGFDTMCELNPQVAKDLAAIATSPGMVLTFNAFHKSYHGAGREGFLRIYTDLPNNPAGRQLATLFQFEHLVVRDASCLAPALAILDAADRVRARQGAGGRR